MAYTLSRGDLDTITDLDVAFGTVSFLPDEDDIPDEFKSGNIYTELAVALFYGNPLPDGDVTFKPAFADEAAVQLSNRCVRAHLKSFAPKHQHKIAGVGYMIAQMCEITQATSSKD